MAPLVLVLDLVLVLVLHRYSSDYLRDPDEEVAEMTQKKPRDSKQGWSPDTGCASPLRWNPTPDQDQDQEQEPPVALIGGSFPHYTFGNIFVTPVRASPLPALCKDVVWNNMLQKDKSYSRDVHVMDKHPHLQPKMRAILLDWLMEVSEVYKLHRESYHLAQDYFDRFMATQSNVFKSTLQLIGITCLFIAAKMEEMYPPKVHQFAYVTDEVLPLEDEILTWRWTYLKETEELLIPRYPQATFTQIAKLLDLCMLDVRCLEFTYGVLAASALFHFSSLELVENVSALKRVELDECDKAYSYQDSELDRPGACPMPSGGPDSTLSSEKTEEVPRVSAAAAAAVASIGPRMSGSSAPEPKSQVQKEELRRAAILKETN
ncbi:hypothetical protein CRUP_036314 [Coryphaenoides rupestris]|nr:hypothetical protein CRUP_036314 [Coryphaenoides rupestris]